jgi:hypothetical protein
VFHGTWGTAAFQSLYEGGSPLAAFPLMPEWYLVIAGLAAVSALGLLWHPLLWTLVLLGLAVAAPVGRAIVEAGRASFPGTSWAERAVSRALTGALCLLQPAARLGGRVRTGLAPWARRGAAGVALPRPRTLRVWSEQWTSAEDRLRGLEARLAARGAAVIRGGDFDRWDLEVRGGLLGAARVRVALEEHGSGRQLVRVRLWPRASRLGLAVAAVLAGLCAPAAATGEMLAAAVLAVGAAVPAAVGWRACAAATATFLRELGGIDARAHCPGTEARRARAGLAEGRR